MCQCVRVCVCVGGFFVLRQSHIIGKRTIYPQQMILQCLLLRTRYHIEQAGIALCILHVLTYMHWPLSMYRHTC